MIGDDSPVAAAALGVDLVRKTGRIVSIYTRPDMRRKKAGAMLMEALIKLSTQYDLTRMECFFTDGNINRNSKETVHDFSGIR